jgi:hypothetical protein
MSRDIFRFTDFYVAGSLGRLRPTKKHQLRIVHIISGAYDIKK